MYDNVTGKTPSTISSGSIATDVEYQLGSDVKVPTVNQVKDDISELQGRIDDVAAGGTGDGTVLENYYNKTEIDGAFGSVESDMLATSESINTLNTKVASLETNTVPLSEMDKYYNKTEIDDKLDTVNTTVSENTKDIEDLAIKVADAEAAVADLSSYATNEDVIKFYTETNTNVSRNERDINLLEGRATELENTVVVTSDLDRYYTKVDTDNLFIQTNGLVQGNTNKIAQVQAELTAVKDNTVTKVDIVNYPTKSEVTASIASANTLLDEKLESLKTSSVSKVDLVNYNTKSEVSDMLSSTTTAINTNASNIIEISDEVVKIQNTVVDATTKLADGLIEIEDVKVIVATVQSDIDILKAEGTEDDKTVLKLQEDLDKLTQVVENYRQRIAALENKPEVDLTNYYDKTEVDGIVTTATDALDVRLTTLETTPESALPLATTATVGAVKIGNNLTIDVDGTVHGNDPQDLSTLATKDEVTAAVTLLEEADTAISTRVDALENTPGLGLATVDSAGAIKVGANLTITNDGTLNAISDVTRDTSSLANYYTKSQAKSNLTNAQNLLNYYNKQYIDALVTTAPPTSTYACMINGETTGASNEIQAASLGVSGTVTTNKRYVLSNPFGKDTHVIPVVELLVNDTWTPVEWEYSASMQHTYGILAFCVQGEGIVIVTGTGALVASNYMTVHGNHDKTVVLHEAKARVHLHRTGAIGAQGNPGQKGATFIPVPVVNEDVLTLSWTNDAHLTNPEPITVPLASVVTASNFKGRVDNAMWLPTTGNRNGDIWLIGEASSTTCTAAVYLEETSSFKQIGSASVAPGGGIVDLSDYYTKIEVDRAINENTLRIDALSTLSSSYATKEEVASLDIKALKGRVNSADLLPVNGKDGDIWLVGSPLDDHLDTYTYLKEVGGFKLTGSTTEVDLSDYYTKSEMDSSLQGIDTKFDDYYTKAEVNAPLTNLNDKFDGYYTKEEVDTTFESYHTKDEINAATTVLGSRIAAIETDYINNEALTNALNNMSVSSLKGRVDSKDQLPKTGNKNGDLWLVGAVDSTDYSEFIYFDEIGAFEMLGSLNTGAVDLSNYLTIASATTLLAGKADLAVTDALDARVQTLESAPGPDLAPYATKTEQAAALALKADSTTVADLEDRLEVVENRETIDLTPYATMEGVNNITNALDGRVTALENEPEVDLSLYATTADVNTALATKASVTVTDNLSSRITDIENAPGMDLSAYATTAAMNTALANKTDTTVTTTLAGRVTTLENRPDVDLTPYATKSSVNAELANKASTAEATALSDRITTLENEPEIDLSGYAAKNVVDALNVKVLGIEASYASTEYVTEEINKLDIPTTEDFATSASVSSLAGRVLTLENAPEQDLSEYATKTFVETAFDSTPMVTLKGRVDDFSKLSTATARHGDLWLVGKAGETPYEEYIYVDDTKTFEFLGSIRQDDLLPYAKIVDVDEADAVLRGRIDVIEADYVTAASLSLALGSITVSVLKGRVDTAADLPTENNVNGDLWLVGLEGAPAFDEYIYFAEISTFEKLGSVASTSVDLNNYYTKTQVDTMLGDVEAKVDLNTSGIGGVSTLVNTFESRLEAVETGEHIDLSEYAKTADLTPLFAAKADVETTNSLDSRVTTLEEKPEVDLSAYATTESVTSVTNSITTRLDNVESSITTLGNSSLKGRVDSKDDLPVDGNKNGDIYLVGLEDATSFEEYIYFEEKSIFEKLGSVDLGEIDLSNYYTKTEADVITDGLDTRVLALENEEPVDLSGYVTTEAMNTAVSVKTDITVTGALSARVDTLEEIDLTPYATIVAVNNGLGLKADVTVTDGLDTRVTALENEPEVDLTDYYTKTEVDAAIDDASLGGSVELQNYYTKTEVDNIVGNIEISSVKGRVDTKAELPTTDNKNGDIYFVGLTTDESFDEYIYFEEKSAFELLGSVASSSVDLSGYYTKAEADAITTAIANRVTAIEDEDPIDLSGYATTTAVANGLASKTDSTVTMALAERVTTLENEPEVDLTPYATIASVTTGLSGKTDTSVTEAINTRLTTLEGVPAVDLTPYSTIAYVDESIATAVSSIDKASLKGRVDTVGDLPTEDNKNGDLWLVGATDAVTLEEYIYFGELSSFEKLGSVSVGEIDLSNYYTKTAVNDLFTATNGNVTANGNAITAVAERVTTLENEPEIDLSGYATTAAMSDALLLKSDVSVVTGINDRVTALEGLTSEGVATFTVTTVDGKPRGVLSFA